MVVAIIMVINSVIDGFAWWTQYDWLLQLSDYSQVSDDSCIKWLAKNKAAVGPVKLEEIVLVIIRRTIILWSRTRLSINSFCRFLYQFFTSACTAFVGDFALNRRMWQIWLKGWSSECVADVRNSLPKYSVWMGRGWKELRWPTELNISIL